MVLALEPAIGFEPTTRGLRNRYLKFYRILAPSVRFLSDYYQVFKKMVSLMSAFENELSGYMLIGRDSI